MSDAIFDPQSPEALPAASPASPASPAPDAPDASPAAPQGTPKDPISKNSLNDDLDALSAKQRLAIDLLAAGRTLSQVAEMSGVNRKTLYVWRHEDAAFCAAVRARRHELWGDAAGRLRAMLPRAIDIIARELDARYDRARVDAAKTILRMVDWRAVLKEEGESADA